MRKSAAPSQRQSTFKPPLLGATQTPRTLNVGNVETQPQPNATKLVAKVSTSDPNPASMPQQQQPSTSSILVSQPPLGIATTLSTGVKRPRFSTPFKVPFKGTPTLPPMQPLATPTVFDPVETASNMASASMSATETVTATEPASKRTKFTPMVPKALLIKPALSTKTPVATSSTSLTVSGSAALVKCYNVLWRTKQKKMHRTWDGDGILVITGSVGVIKDLNGAEICKRTTMKVSSLKEGDELSFGNKDVEIGTEVAKELYETGQCFIKTTSAAPPLAQVLKPTRPVAKFKAHTNAVIDQIELESRKNTPKPNPVHSPTSPNAIVLPRPPLNHPRMIKRAAEPFYNNSGHTDSDSLTVDVVVDPILGQHLRPHQVEGVKFLYECVMGMKDFNGQGAILADEMGLGKTLQAITLIWTLLKQSPYYGEESAVIKRVLVVCPASLIMNWKKEFKRWLGDERLKVFAVDSNSSLTDFTLGRVFPVMIIGYEKLRTVQDQLGSVKFDLVICDEGHRLKTANIKTSQAIRSLSHSSSPNQLRRVILSGTPIQNDLGEFYAMMDFVNPGLFESYTTFKKVFEDPIMKSRQKNSSIAEQDLGKTRSLELSRLTGLFILRRTAEINRMYLPKRTEMVLFIKPSKEQVLVYRKVLELPLLKNSYGGISKDSSRYLACIIALRKLCNSPSLLLDQEDEEDDRVEEEEQQQQQQQVVERNHRDGGIESKNTTAIRTSLYSSLKSTLDGTSATTTTTTTSSSSSSTTITTTTKTPMTAMDFMNHGGKLAFVAKFLEKLCSSTSERVVLVSNFTKTLDLLAQLCDSYSYLYYRLDGNTLTSKRQEFVDKFNRPDCDRFIFLLSSKSGGVGLNLIGASRLILFDVDWNPSMDLQAMARIYREGQKKPVKIYRLLTSGTIEEKMFQRQLTKLGLSDTLMMDGNHKMNNGLNKFSEQDLKDLFTVHEQQVCWTHTLLNCRDCLDFSPISLPLLPYNETTTKSKKTKDKQQSSLSLSSSSSSSSSSAGVTTVAATTTEEAKKLETLQKSLQEWQHLDIEAWKRVAESQLQKVASRMKPIDVDDEVEMDDDHEIEHDKEQRERRLKKDMIGLQEEDSILFDLIAESACSVHDNVAQKRYESAPGFIFIRSEG